MPPITPSSKRRIALIVVVALIIVLGFAATSILTASQRELAQSKARIVELETTKTQAPPASAPAQDASPLSRATAALPVDAGKIVFAARASDAAYLFVTWTGEGSDVSYRYWHADVGTGTSTLIVSRQLGPAPVFSYDPYQLSFGYIHLKTVDSWEGLSFEHDDYVDLATRSLLLTVSRQTEPGHLVLERGGSHLTIEYMYKGVCATAADDGKQVDVIGIKVNGSRELPFTKAKKASCSYSDMRGEGVILVSFDDPYLSVEGNSQKPAFVNVGTMTGARIVVPLDGMEDASKLKLEE